MPPEQLKAGEGSQGRLPGGGMLLSLYLLAQLDLIAPKPTTT